MSNGDPLAPAWVPDETTVEHAQVTRLMRRRGFDSFADLHRWSVEEPDAFWSDVIDELGVVFERTPEAIRGSEDPEDPQWLPGASFNIVASCLDHDASALAIVDGCGPGVREISVAELRSAVASFAGGFAAAGFEPGEAVAIVMPMTVEAVVAYLGTIAAGGVVVSIADSFAPDEIAVRFAIADPVAVVTQTVATRAGRTLPMYGKCIDADAPTCIVVDAGDGPPLRPGDIGWTDFVTPGADFAPVPTPADATTNILFSSGTTGEPKAIPWTQTTPIKAAMDGRFHHDIHAGDVVAWPTNLGWMMGPWLIYASLLNEAAMALYVDAPTTREFVRFVDEAAVTMLGLVPSIVAAWRAADLLHEGDWSEVRVISSTGEASNPDDYAWLTDVAGGVPIVEYCGGTEIGGGYVTSTVLHGSIPSRFATPALGLDLVLLDEEGRLADTGEVFLVPPSMGLSTSLLNRDHHDVYYEGVPVVGRPLRRHGDQMRRDPNGYYQALGRVDDTMNLGGIKVSSADLEGAVADVEGLAECAAVAVPPEGGGPDRLVIFVVPAGEGGLDLDAVRSEMQRRIRERLNPLFRVDEVIAIEALPRTASHKVMRRTLRAQVEASRQGT